MRILKSLLFVTFLFGLFVPFSFARDRDVEISGKIESIDADNLTFAIKGNNTAQVYTFKVDDATDIELEMRRKDTRLAFKDLKVGDDVKVEYYPDDSLAVQVADEIDVYR